MTVYLFACSLVWEVPLARQVEQHRTTIINRPIIRWPLSVGVAADAFTCALDFEQRDCGVLAVTSWVEVYVLPPMNRPAVKKCSDQSLITQQFEQELLLFFLWGTSWILNELIDKGSKLIRGSKFGLLRFICCLGFFAFFILQSYWGRFIVRYEVLEDALQRILWIKNFFIWGIQLVMRSLQFALFKFLLITGFIIWYNDGIRLLLLFWLFLCNLWKIFCVYVLVQRSSTFIL